MGVCVVMGVRFDALEVNEYLIIYACGLSSCSLIVCVCVVLHVCFAYLFVDWAA